MQRRDWIKQTSASGIAALTSGAVLGDAESAGALSGQAVSQYDQSVAELVGGDDITPDERVELLVPEDAANGAVVPVGVVSSVPDTKKIVLLVSDHWRARVASLDTSNPMLAPRFSTHLQLIEATTITALVQSESGWFSQTARVKTLGEDCEK